MKVFLPVAISTISALLLIGQFFFKIDSVSQGAATLQAWGIVVAAFALGIGAVNLLTRHTKTIARKQPAAIYSVLLLTSMLLTVFLGLTAGTNAKSYRFLFTNILTAASGTLYASVAMYIATSAYRAFRAKNLDAWVLLLSAVIVMLGNAPVGAIISKYLPEGSVWIRGVPATAGMRAIMMGAALGVLSSAIKSFLGLERSYLSAG